MKNALKSFCVAKFLKGTMKAPESNLLYCVNLCFWVNSILCVTFCCLDFHWKATSVLCTRNQMWPGDQAGNVNGFFLPM